MERWQKLLQKSLTTAEEVAEVFGLKVDEIRRVAGAFRIRINPYYLSLIKAKGDPLYLQMVPDARELEGTCGLADPLAENQDSPVPGIVHRYPDRVLFLVSHECASYCRFCTRKRMVGDFHKMHPQFIENGLAYIRQHSEIRDVIVSGGDPLLLSDERLEGILRELRAIPHVEIIRIGTRVPCVLPQRVTAKLARMLKKYHPLFMNVHFNHPDEITPQSAKALNRLADVGIPLGTQTVLLKGVNDDPAVMRSLMQKLLACRVRPYYIYQADQVAGTEHLRTTVAKGLEVIKGLRGWTSGLAVPHFVIDTPGGGGKVPLLPDYVVSMTDKEVVLRNYEGKAFVYKQVRTRSVPVAPQVKVPTPMEAWALKEQAHRRKVPADGLATPASVMRG